METLVWICLHSTDSNRELYVRVDQIDLIAEKKLEGHYTDRGVWIPTAKGGEVVLRSGESGICKETPAEIFAKIREVAAI